MSDKKYNGWTNQATWKVAVRCNYLRDVLFYKENLGEFGGESDESLICEVVMDFYNDVNWHELENADWTDVEE